MVYDSNIVFSKDLAVKNDDFLMCGAEKLPFL